MALRKFGVLAVLLLASLAQADVVYLNNGTQKEGKIVGNEGGTVVLEVTIGSLKANLRYAEDEIARVEKVAPPAEVFQEKLAAIKPGDAEAYYQLGRWAEGKHLTDQAKEAYEKAMKTGKGHAGAAAELGYVELDGQWVPQADAMRRLQEMYDKGQFEAVYQRLSRLKQVPLETVPHGLRGDVYMLYAKSCERVGKWNEATEAWRLYAVANKDKVSNTVAAVRTRIIQEHPDGRYTCNKNTCPAIVLTNDPTVLPLLEPAGVKSLTDEAVMNLALKEKAGVLLEEARKYADKVVDYSDASIAAWKTALKKAATASRMLAGAAKEMRLEIIKRVFAFHDQHLQGAGQELEKRMKANAGDPSAADECLDKGQRVLEAYQDSVEFLKDFQKDLPDEYAKAQQGVTRETQRVKWLQDQADLLKIRKRASDLDEKAVAVLNKAKAADPRKQTYLNSPDTGEFQDGGKEWRQRADAAVRLANQAYATLADMLQEYNKRPELFAAEIESTKNRMAQCDAYRAEVAAVRNRKGISINGAY